MYTLIILSIYLLFFIPLSKSTPSKADCLEIKNAIESFGGKHLNDVIFNEIIV
jgi:hypothetical protein